MTLTEAVARVLAKRYGGVEDDGPRFWMGGAGAAIRAVRKWDREHKKK